MLKNQVRLFCHMLELPIDESKSYIALGFRFSIVHGKYGLDGYSHVASRNCR